MSTPKACILSVSGERLTPGEARLFARANPWGVILMGRSCGTPSQVRLLVDEIWSAIGRPCLIFIDQEGGRVARLKAPDWPVFPRGSDYGALYENDPEAAKRATWLGHRLIARELSRMSIHADCAPVVDLPVPGAHDVIGDRAFGTDPVQVSELGRAALEGLAAGGVAGVVKHIPGHGRSMADSHLELPRVTAGGNELAKDFDAFARLSDAPMAMTAHIAYDSIDPERAATVSNKLISEVIRTRIGFDGLLMSDDLGMKALGGALADRTRAALSAGCDVVLHCAGFEKDSDKILAEMTEVADASMALEARAMERAERAEAMATSFEPIDADAAWGELRRIFPNLASAA